MRSVYRWLILLGFNLVLVALLLEMLLRLTAPALPAPLAATAQRVMTGQPYAQAWTPAWQENRDHGYALRPGLNEALQYGSPSVSFHLSTIELWEGGGIGFRTRPVDYYVDAVVVGDSFGFCFTERDDCWVSHLERLTGWGLVNLSQPVTGTTSHLRILERFGAPLTPDWVIWQFFGNDFNDDYGLMRLNDEVDAPENDENALISAEDEPTPDHGLLDGLRRNSVLVAVLETALTGRYGGLPQAERIFEKPYAARYGEHVLYFGGLYERQALAMAREVNQIGYQRSRESFQAAQTLVAALDARLVVVLIPTREEVYQHLTEDVLGAAELAKLRSAREAMLTLCEALDLACFDPLPLLRERALQNEALYYADDMHLNPHGNRVLAEALASWLAEQTAAFE